MITIQKLTDEAYVITVDGEESLEHMRQLARAAYHDDHSSEEAHEVVLTLLTESWRDESPN